MIRFGVGKDKAGGVVGEVRGISYREKIRSNRPQIESRNSVLAQDTDGKGRKISCKAYLGQIIRKCLWEAKENDQGLWFAGLLFVTTVLCSLRQGNLGFWRHRRKLMQTKEHLLGERGEQVHG